MDDRLHFLIMGLFRITRIMFIRLSCVRIAALIAVVSTMTFLILGFLIELSSGSAISLLE
ncbi:TPA: hypothetical protein HA318_00530 [Candidatus Micrarchaeota archaeon]|nr:hypothetical protein [Candidatus Micrarchaeota archaeon]